MFAKVKERLDTTVKQAQSSVSGGGGGGRPMPSIIGPDMTVTGNLSTPGEVRVEGRVEGDVTCARLIIGEGGLIQGKVTAESVKVHGKVDGAIDAGEVFLLAGSEVLGDIFQGTLEIAPGAQFEGAVRRRTGSTRPIAVLEPPAAAPDLLEREGHFEPVDEVEEAKPAAPPKSVKPATKADKVEKAEKTEPAAETHDTEPEARAPEAGNDSAPEKAKVAAAE